MTIKSNHSALNSISNGLNSGILDNKIESEITFVSTTTGTVATHDLLTVTGVVAMQIFAVCSTNLAGASATIEVGTTTSTAGLIAQTTATDIDANEIWHDASPDTSIELVSVLTSKIVTEDVSYKIGTAAISAGVLKFIVLWTPISIDGNVVLS